VCRVGTRAENVVMQDLTPDYPMWRPPLGESHWPVK